MTEIVGHQLSCLRCGGNYNHVDHWDNTLWACFCVACRYFTFFIVKVDNQGNFKLTAHDEDDDRLRLKDW